MKNGQIIDCLKCFYLRATKFIMSKKQFKIRSSIYPLLIFIILCASPPCWSQTYSLAVRSSNFSLDGQNFNGYSTEFVQPFKEVKKAWWSYVNARTIIFNNKTHLLLTIPAKGKEVNEPLKFVTQTIQNKGSKRTSIKLALVTDNVPDDQKTELSKKAHHLLKDFKVNYFTEMIQEKINDQEKISKKISLEMDKLLLTNSRLQMRIERKPEEKNQLAQKLKNNTAEIEKLQSKLNLNNKKLSQHKKELALIK